MANKTGKITATEPTEPGSGGEDQSLPDPTSTARWFLAGCIVVALVAAFVANAAGWATKSFEPSADETANFALFAGFYVAAQVIERLMELVSPLLPFWGLPDKFSQDPKVRAVQVKADRAKAALGLALLAGVVASCGFGLYFLAAVGMDVPRMPDIFFTGLIIAAGTKPLHDLTTAVQNKNSPTSGTSTTS
jgi:hypothetical protein